MATEAVSDGQNHIWHIRVYYEDTDAQGIVYYANYLKFIERARTEMFRKLDMSPSKIQHEHGALIVVSRCDLRFKRSAKLEDLLQIHTNIKLVGGAKIVLLQNVVCNDQLLVTAEVELACINGDGRPQRVPKALTDCLLTDYRSNL
ncbi:MAG: tol-pal system-associated acyl-CoA thioesterase [Alphaproteobacteria bacterium]